MRQGYLVMDLETVPDTELYAHPDTPFGEEKPFPPIFAHRPVAIGVLWLGADLRLIRLGIIGEGQDERGQLDAFSEFVAREGPTLVTWNGRGFDLPVIVLRCLRHGVGLGWYYGRRDVRYRYSDDGHLDLGDALCDRGATRQTSLDNAARLIGLPGKMGVDGSQVEGLFRAGRIDEIRQYCLTDVIQTAMLLLRYLLLSGREERAAVVEALNGLLEALGEDGRFPELLAGINRPRLLLE
ncbi:MAG: 3'-5' exonuclease [bacterium]